MLERQPGAGILWSGNTGKVADYNISHVIVM